MQALAKWKIGCFGVVICCLLSVGKSGDDPIHKTQTLPDKLRDSVQGIITEFFPNAKIQYTDGTLAVTHDLKRLTIYRMDYRKEKEGELAKTSEEVTGPANAGFSMTLESRPTKYNGMAGRPYGTFRDMFWRTYINEYQLAEDRGVLRLRCDYGAEVDTSVIRRIHDLLALHGKPIGVDEGDELQSLLNELHERVKTVLRRFCPQAELRREDRRISSQFHTRTLTIHTTNEVGSVSLIPHTEIAPEDDGFTFKISYTGRVIDSQKHATCGKVIYPYWTEYFNSFEVHGAEEFIRFEVRHGNRVKRELFAEIERMLGTVGTAAIRGTFDVK